MEIDYTDEEKFKTKLRKLYRIVIDESLKHGINLIDYTFIQCSGIFDLIDINYTNGIQDFDVSVRGGERNGYRVLYSGLSETLNDNDIED